jgi:hypothetical protein
LLVRQSLVGDCCAHAQQAARLDRIGCPFLSLRAACKYDAVITAQGLIRWSDNDRRKHNKSKSKETVDERHNLFGRLGGRCHGRA